MAGFLPLLGPLVVEPAEVEFNDGVVKEFTFFEPVIIVPGYADGSFAGLVDKHSNGLGIEIILSMMLGWSQGFGFWWSKVLVDSHDSVMLVFIGSFITTGRPA